MKIDGKDILQEYNCILLDGSLGEVLKYPKRKTVQYNDWAEADGIQPDISEVEFEPRHIRLSLFFNYGSKSGFLAIYRRLIAGLTAPGYRKVTVIDGFIMELRLNETTGFNVPRIIDEGENHVAFTLDFIEDNNSILGVPYPVDGINLRGHCSINDIDFGAFGAGFDEAPGEILKYPDMKEPFTDGKSVYLSTINTRHREIRIRLWMLASNKDIFLNNHRALFGQLASPGLQDLYFNATGDTIPVYYSECTEFNIGKWSESGVAARFSISLIAPIASWIEAGGSSYVKLLLDDDRMLYISDEDGKLLEVK
ncbi:MAG: hypothetical protein LBU37_02245 [Tannerellaceae bacterium]|jgi:hypothetical protein|nr:hypothetical protein [Tannerellaceae bacterium]